MNKGNIMNDEQLELANEAIQIEHYICFDYLDTSAPKVAYSFLLPKSVLEA